jgi:hypothetical protein
MNILKALMEPVQQRPCAAAAAAAAGGPAPPAARSPSAAAAAPPRFAPSGGRFEAARGSGSSSSGSSLCSGQSGPGGAGLPPGAAGLPPGVPCLLPSSSWSPRTDQAGAGGYYPGQMFAGPGRDPLTGAAAAAGSFLPSSLSCPLPQQAYSAPTSLAQLHAVAAAEAWPPGGQLGCGVYTLAPSAAAAPRRDGQLLLLPASMQVAAAPASPPHQGLPLLAVGAGSGLSSHCAAPLQEQFRLFMGSGALAEASALQQAHLAQIHAGLYTAAALQPVP